MTCVQSLLFDMLVWHQCCAVHSDSSCKVDAGSNAGIVFLFQHTIFVKLHAETWQGSNRQHVAAQPTDPIGGS